jgi:hypothetical protein
MPFKSEKQRRFLWLKHPDIAKRWADEYPGQKNLPTYVSDKKEDKPKETAKSAALDVLQRALGNSSTLLTNSQSDNSVRPIVKKSNSILETVAMPQDDKPTYAGEKPITKKPKPETEDEGSIGDSYNAAAPSNTASLVENPLIQKLAVVLAPRIQQAIEQERAEAEARQAVRVPQNVNVKQYPIQSNLIPPPMGMAQAPAQPQAPQPSQPQAPQPAQANPQQYASVGGGNTPNANPINSFGGLSTSGDINGNAALGTRNMAGGEKMADQKCSCGCGQKVSECKCPPSCSCRQKGGSCCALKTEKQSTDALFCTAVEKWAGKQLGLWDRIRMKRERGGKPAKPGDKDYPDSKSWKKVTNISEKKAGKNEEGGMSAKAWKDALEAERLAHKATEDSVVTWYAQYKKKLDRAHTDLYRVQTDLSNAQSQKTLAEQALSDAQQASAVNASTARKQYDDLNANYTKSREWLTNPRLWTGFGIGAAGVLGAYGLKKLYDRYKKPKPTAAGIGEKQSASPAWQRSAGKNEEGGLNAKGRASYNKATGGHLKAPVTESNPTGKAKARRHSFCSRMCGMKRVNTGAGTAKDPDSRINKSLRKWNCKCSSAREFGEKIAEYFAGLSS